MTNLFIYTCTTRVKVSFFSSSVLFQYKYIVQAHRLAFNGRKPLQREEKGYLFRIKYCDWGYMQCGVTLKLCPVRHA